MTFLRIPPLTVGQLAEIYAETLSRIYRVKITISVDDRRGEKHVIEYDHPDIKEQPAEDQARGIPGGCTLVPLDPTEEMLRAGVYAFQQTKWQGKDNLADWRACYKAMIVVAPKHGGYKLVPINPTKEQLGAAASAMYQRFARDGGFCGHEAGAELGRECYTAMLAATPSQAAAPDEVE